MVKNSWSPRYNLCFILIMGVDIVEFTWEKVEIKDLKLQLVSYCYSSFDMWYGSELGYWKKEWKGSRIYRLDVNDRTGCDFTIQNDW